MAMTADIDMEKLKKISREALFLLVHLPDDEMKSHMEAVCTRMIALAEENERLRGNQRPFTMPDIDGMTAKEDGTHHYRRSRR